jgi:uncharacterized protein
MNEEMGWGGDGSFKGLVTNDLLRVVRAEFVMSLDGVHGWSHWLRVRENGLRVAEASGADPVLVELFALLHDVKRRSDLLDPKHGHRAAEYVRSLGRDLLPLPTADIELLAYACRHHSGGQVQGDVTIRTCWDADRLDLGRVGIRPRADKLCTEAAKDPALIEWANDRSLEHRRKWWAWYG